MPIRNGKRVNWKVKVKGIRPLITSDTSLKYANYAGKEIYKILTSKRYGKYFEDFEHDALIDLEEFNHVEDCDHLNSLLHDLYDYCDANLIWIDFD